MKNNKTRFRKIGIVKAKVLDKAFDQFYDFYKRKAEGMGYCGDLKFIKEKSRVFIYTVIENYDDNLQEYPLDSENESELDD